MDAEAFGHQVAEACRVQVGAAADDTVLGQTAQFPGHIGEHVHCGGSVYNQGLLICHTHANRSTDDTVCVSVFTGVGDHDERAVGAVLDDLGDDGLEDVDVPLDQVEAALPLLLADAGRHNDQARVGCHGVVWGRKRGGENKT